MVYCIFITRNIIIFFFSLPVSQHLSLLYLILWPISPLPLPLSLSSSSSSFVSVAMTVVLSLGGAPAKVTSPSTANTTVIARFPEPPGRRSDERNKETSECELKAKKIN